MTPLALPFDELLNIADPRNMLGALLGAATVFLFSGLTINAVSRSAGAVVMEVRRQFRELPGIMSGTQRPEYGKVVDICTKDAQRELLTPGLLAIMAPIAVGFGLGAGALAAFLAGAIAAGVLMAIFLVTRVGRTTPRRLSRTAPTAGRTPGARRDGHRHPWVTRSGRWSCDQPAAEGDEPGGAAGGAGGGDLSVGESASGLCGW